MKLLSIFCIPLFVCTTVTAQTKPKTQTVPHKSTGTSASSKIILKTLTDSASYAIGQNIAQSISKDLEHLNKEAFLNAIKTVFEGQSPLFGEEDIRTVLTAFSREQETLEAKETIDAGHTFLEKNKTRPGVITTPSGLQYKILTQGTGPKPTAEDTVICNYVGRLADSTEFDNSYARGNPLTIVVADVIKGWTEGLQLMSPGSKYRFYVPYELGYGLQGAPPTIPGGALLIFDIELLEIKKAGAL